MIAVTLPIRLISEANERDHWAKRARRVKSQKNTTALLLRGRLRGHDLSGPLVVTITRVIGPRGKALDSDNAHGAAKAVRDAVAACLGVDDGDNRVAWRVEQRKGDDWETEVRIEGYR